MLQVLSSGVPPHEDGQEGDAGGGDPGNADHQHGSPHCDGQMVLQGLGYCVVPEGRFVKIYFNLEYFWTYSKPIKKSIVKTN